MSEKNNQLVGNAGLYYLCWELTKIGWNVMPTSRNTRGIDVVIYSQDGKRFHLIQVKSLSKRNPVPLGKPENLIAEFLIVVREALNEKPSIFILKVDEVKSFITIAKNQKGEISYWLDPKKYESYMDKWGVIGNGFKEDK